MVTMAMKVFTLVAWSNSTLNPFVLLLFDYSVGTACRLGGCAGSRGGQVTAESRRQSVYDRVGSRLCNEGHTAAGPAPVLRPNGLFSERSSVDEQTVRQLPLETASAGDDADQPWAHM